MSMMESPAFKAIQKGITYLLGERIIRIFIGVFVHVLVVRELGPETFGIYGLAMSFFVIAQPFVNYGADDLVLNDLIEKDAPVAKIMSSVFWYKLTWAMISYVGLVSFVWWKGVGDQVLTLVLILGAYNIFNTLSVVELRHQSQMRFRVISAGRFISYLIFAILKIVMIFYFLNVYWLAAFYTLEIFVARLLMVTQLHEKIEIFTASKSYMINFFKKTWPYLLTVFVLVLNQRIGLFFLNEHRSIIEVGNYNVLLSLTKFFDFIPLALLTAFMPKLFETQKQNAEKYRNRISAIYFILITFGLSMTFGVGIFSELMVEIMYGEKYVYLPEVLPLGFLALTVTFINLFKARHFLIEKLFNDWLVYNIVVLVVLILLLSLLTGQFGITGVVLSYIAAYLCVDILFVIFYPRYRKIFWRILAAVKTPYLLIKTRTI